MRCLIFLVLTSCWTSSQPGESHKASPPPVEVAIASIRLGDDCPDAAQAELAQGKSAVAGDCAGECNFARMCEQTSLQVSLRSTATAKTNVGIKKVELLDGAGTVIGTLKARVATRWTNDGSFAAWDQSVAAGEVMAASYALTAPDWGLVPGGRDPARKIKVRVTFAIGDGEKVFEKEAVVTAFSEPNVVT